MIIRLLKWVSLLAGVAMLTSFTFSIYAHFLIDYSLEDLQLAIAATDSSQELPALNRNLYGGLMQDLAMDEAAQEDIDIKNLVLLEQASRSLVQSEGPLDNKRAKLYLNQITNSKLPNRNPFLRTTDTLYSIWQRAYQSFFSFTRYLLNVFSRQEESPFEVSSQLLLNQAQELEKNLEYEKAGKLYQKYLELYPNHSDRSTVMVILAQTLIKQKKLKEAKNLLRDVRLAFVGSEEGNIASSLLRRIANMEQRELRIEKLKQLIPANADSPLAEQAQFKLGLEYLHSQSLGEALEIFKSLENAQDKNIRQKSKFYRGWIHKMRARYEEAEKALFSLRDEEELDGDLELGVEALLADIAYQKRDLQGSINRYEAIAKKISGDAVPGKTSSAAWAALAELEQAGIYYVDLGDGVRGVSHLKKIDGRLLDKTDWKVLEDELKTDPRTRLKTRAFRALQKKQVRVALDLFSTYLTFDPTDAASHAGLAIVYALLSDLDRAKSYSAKANQLENHDEYTLSVDAYVRSLRGEHERAAALYQEALEKNPAYIPARFNLAVEYLETKKYNEGLDVLTELEHTFTDVRDMMRSKILNNMGYALWWLGDHNQAEDRFRQALDVTPDFPDAKKNLEQISLGHAPQAMPSLQLLNQPE